MKKFNKELVVSVKLIEKEHRYSIEYLSEKKSIFGKVKRKAGLYYIGWSYISLYTPSSIEYVENNKVYYNPYIILNMADGSTIEKFFDDVASAKAYITENFSHFKSEV